MPFTSVSAAWSDWRDTMGQAKYNIRTAVDGYMTEVGIDHRYLHLMQVRQMSSLCPRPLSWHTSEGGTDHAQQAAVTRKDAAEQQAQQAEEKRQLSLLDVYQAFMVVCGLAVAGVFLYNTLVAKAQAGHAGGNVPLQLQLSVAMAFVGLIVTAVVHLVGAVVAWIKYTWIRMAQGHR